LLEKGDGSLFFATPDQRGYIDSLAFAVNGQSVRWHHDDRHKDIAVLYPEQPLLPGDSIRWTSPFRVMFPDAVFSRLGHHRQAYFATQWYPKPAVYDSRGWHPMPYMSDAEFYSEFGNVDLYLTLPANYTVASSGELRSWPEMIRLMEMAQATRVAGIEGLPDRHDFPASDTILKTIHLSQNRVHDFAWVADKRFYVAKSRVQLPRGNQQVHTWTFFYKNAQQWLKSTAILNEALMYFSSELGNYPWPSMSAAMIENSGGANMEYPALTLIDAGSSDALLEQLLVHETAHNWFYGALASNERAFPWLDEGFAQFYENKFLEEKYPGKKLLGPLASTLLAEYFSLGHFSHRAYFHLWVLFTARLHLDQPVELSAAEYTPFNYVAIVYYKAALALYYLQNYLGEELFQKAMLEYYDTWAFRHPYPQDVQDVFERVTGRNLSWFFEDLIQTTGKIDYALTGVDRSETDSLLLQVKNKGDLKVPFPVSGIRNDSVVQTTWFEGFRGEQELLFAPGDYDALRIDANGVMPELFRHNNAMRTSGLFPRTPPLELQPLASLEDPWKSQVFFAPVLGWNQYNGFMPGMAFYNNFFPPQPTQVLVMPMYGTRNDHLAGMAWLRHYIYPDQGGIHSWEAELNIRRFSFTSGKQSRDFNRLQASLHAVLRKPYPRSPLDRTLRFRHVRIARDHYAVVNQEVVTRRQQYYINELEYKHDNEQLLNPWSGSLKAQQGKGFARLSGELVFSVHYPRSPQGVEVRWFAGAFLVKPSAHSEVNYRFRLAGVSGSKDFLYDHTFLGRSESAGTLLGNQILEAEGGLKYPVSVGQTWDWLTAVNIKADLPLVPAKIYFDAGTYQGAADAFIGSTPLPWVLGVQAVLLGGLLEVNLPVAASPDLQQAVSFTAEEYWQKVTFTLNVDRLDPFRLLRELPW
ncbi:MAG: M1 family metallopeptidase, partial [Bacteroidales bacterium]